MKSIILSLLTLSVLFLLSFTLGETLKIGDTMPMQDARVKDVKTEKEQLLKDFKKEKGLLIMFSCNTCPYVIKNQDRTNEICQYAQKLHLGVLILNSNEDFRNGVDSYDEMKKYYKSQNYNWSYAVDQNHSIADAFGANKTPECFLFDKDLKLVYHGAIDDNPSDATAVSRKHLQIAIDELTANKEITVKTSKSVGCSIKRKKN